MPEIRCPHCGSDSFIPVAYGTPDDAMIQLIETGQILHGGCAISGLMQAYYCVNCDVRYDPQCTPEFLKGIQTLTYSDVHQTFIIYFEAQQLRIFQNNQIQIIPYTAELQTIFSQTQIEFWQSTEKTDWRIVIKTIDYFRESIELTGTHTTPVAYAALLKWFELINLNIH